MAWPRLKRWIWLAAVALIVSLGTLSSAQALGDRTLTPNVQEALMRMSGGSASEADRALLFANNDAVNAARLNGEITDSVYQAAQSDFADLNRQFAADAAAHAGADFTVQQRTSQTFSPGTDSDYITIVKDKEQIGRMQADYNRRVNDYLQSNGAIDKPRTNWQKKLDTDFMADPRGTPGHPMSEADFREIAEMNNDAYRRRMSAEYERISRAKGGAKIGPEHVTAYTEEMSEFARKKKGKISEMFKNPSLFNDPANRAKVIQMMAQEQKYIARVESLDDYLRAQEGLPPRNRAGSIAKGGAIRDPHNVARIKEAHRVAEASRGKAIEDLAETMGEVARRNPAFSQSAADDLVRILAQAPPGHRAGAIAALRRSNPGLAKTVLTRNPGLLSADDLLRAGDTLTDTARAGDKLSDISKVGRMRKSLTAAAKAMETLGKVAAAADVAVAAGQMKNFVETLNKALDPNISDAEAAELFKQAEAMRQELVKSSLLVAIMERHPIVAVIYGTWTVGCMAGEWVVSSGESGDMVGRSKGTCLDRQMSAWDNMVGTYGTEAEREAQRRALCDKLNTAVKEGRIKIKWPYDESDACNAMKRGEKIADMLEDPKGPESTAQLCANLEGQMGAITALVERGELAAAQGLLARARSKLADVGSHACAGLDGRIAEQSTRIANEAAAQKAKAEAALSKCQFTQIWPILANLPEGPERQALQERLNKALETQTQAKDLVAEAGTQEQQGQLGAAAATLRKAKSLKPCGDVVAEIDEAIGRIAEQQAAVAEEALDACKFKDSRKLIKDLPEGARRAELVERWNRAYETERKARDLVNEAMALKNQGEMSKAIGKLHVARDLQPCASTVTAIDKAVIAINSQLPRNSAECLRIVGRWNWFTGKVADFLSNNTWRTTDGDTGRWSCQSDNAIVVTPDVGTWRDTVRISADGASLAGSNQQGVKVTAQRPDAIKKRECPTGYNPYGCN